MAKRRFFAGIFGQKLTVSFYFFSFSFFFKVPRTYEKRREARPFFHRETWSIVEKKMPGYENR